MTPPAAPTAPACTAPSVRDERLELGRGRVLEARVYEAPGRAPARDAGIAGRPLVLHFHGGAFMSGDMQSGACVAGLLVAAGATVVSLDYPLAPAEPFPAAIEAGLEALQCLHRQRRRLAHGPATLWLAGEEAGGTLAAAVASMARDAQGPPVAGQLLLSPMLDVCSATASLRAADAGRAGRRHAEGWNCYLSRPGDALHPYASPARSRRLGGLPPTLLLSAADDPLRDEAAAWAECLRAAGVAVCSLQWPGRTGWPDSYTRIESPQPAWTDEVVALIAAFLRDPVGHPCRWPGQVGAGRGGEAPPPGTPQSPFASRIRSPR